MYLPTFWKLKQEFRFFCYKKALLWGVPASFMGNIFLILVFWIMHHSFYNWVYTSIIPPPTGVQRREKKKL